MGRKENRGRIADMMISESASGPTDTANLSHWSPRSKRANTLTSSDAQIKSLQHPLHAIMPNIQQYVQAIAQGLPHHLVCGVLVDLYFSKLEWYARCLHQPTFRATAKLMWDGLRNSSAPEVAFLSLYLTVLCLALLFADDNDTSKLGMTSAQAREMCQSTYSAAQSCLWISDFMTNHTLEHLQCIM